MKISFKNMSAGARAALIGGCLAIIAAIGEIIYGAQYEQYADYTVVLTLLIGGALLGAYALLRFPATDWFALAGVVVAGFGLGLFIVNSFNVWADTWGNIQQYGNIVGEFNFFNSQGGPIPAVILIALGLAAEICGIISCFKEKEAA